MYLFVFKLNVIPAWNFDESFYKYSLIDDEEYYEDDLADGDPLYGNNQSGYSSSLKYFVPINTKIDGLKLPIGTINRDRGSIYYLITEDEEEIFINLSNVIFWQFAYIDGYRPLENEDYKVGGYLKRFYQIGPYFLFELILTNLGSTILFTIIILLFSLFSPSYIINYIDYNELGLEIKDKNIYKAIEYFDKAIKRDSRNASYYFNRGLSKFNLKDLEGAIADFNKTLELDPNNSLAKDKKNAALEQRIQNTIQELKDLLK